MSERWIATNSANRTDVYHTDEDCDRLRGNGKRVSEHNSAHLRPCHYCADTVTQSETQDMSAYNALVDAAED